MSVGGNGVGRTAHVEGGREGGINEGERRKEGHGNGVRRKEGREVRGRKEEETKPLDAYVRVTLSINGNTQESHDACEGREEQIIVVP